MLELYGSFANLDADTIGPPAPAGSTVSAGVTTVPAPANADGTWTPAQIAALATSLYGMTPQAQALQLKLAQLNAQQQQALIQAEMSKNQSWSTVWTVGAIAAAGIIGLVVWSAVRKKK